MGICLIWNAVLRPYRKKLQNSPCRAFCLRGVDKIFVEVPLLQ